MRPLICRELEDVRSGRVADRGRGRRACGCGKIPRRRMFESCPPANADCAGCGSGRGRIAIGGQKLPTPKRRAHSPAKVQRRDAEGRRGDGRDCGPLRAPAILRRGPTPIFAAKATRRMASRAARKSSCVGRDGGPSADAGPGGSISSPRKILRQLAGGRYGGKRGDSPMKPVWGDRPTGRTPSLADMPGCTGTSGRALGRSLGSEAPRHGACYMAARVKPANARELLDIENVNGALVGGRA